MTELDLKYHSPNDAKPVLAPVRVIKHKTLIEELKKEFKK